MDGRWSGRRGTAVVVPVVVAICAVVAVWWVTAGPPFGLASRRVDSSMLRALASLPPPGPHASTGVWVQDCGRNDEGHYNADNLVVSPGLVGSAQHLHDYVGNRSTSAASTDATLAAATTTCPSGDLSSYYWPVLRHGVHADSDGADAGRDGLLHPTSVRIEFRGNVASQVVLPPRFLRLTSGEARAVLDGSQTVAAQRVQWSCSAWPEVVTSGYPDCPDGQEVVRTFDFPSCWDGARTDSPNHRAHVTYPAANGLCPPDRYPIPQLRLRIGYRVPAGSSFVIDAVPGQQRSPVTDHAHAILLLPDSLAAGLVACLDEGRRCGPS